MRRIHDTPKTPYQRMLEAIDVSQNVKDRLTKMYEDLSMVELKKKKIDTILELLIKTVIS